MEYLDQSVNFFFTELFEFYKHWAKTDHNSPNFKETMISLHKKVWVSFQKRGFTAGEPFCVIDAFLILINQIESFLKQKIWTILEVNFSEMEETRKEVMKCNSLYVVLVNRSYSSLQKRTFNGLEYSFHSMISFEPLFSDLKTDKVINHYKCITGDKEKKFVFLYFDLMSFKPGGYQGTYLFKKDEKKKDFKKSVPVCLLKRNLN